MARSTKRVPVIGKPDQPYWRAEDMDWHDIEKKTGVLFSEKDRNEIFQCAFIAYVNQSLVSGAASSADVEKLKKHLVRHASGIVEIAQTYRSPDGYFKNDELEAIFLAVAFSSSHPDFDLMTSLLQAAAHCEKIIEALSACHIDAYTTNRAPEVVGLVHFVANAVNGAEARPGQKAAGYLKSPNVFEYHRWGLHLSPQTGQLPVLCSAVFKRHITHGNIQHAFDVARDERLIKRQQ